MSKLALLAVLLFLGAYTVIPQPDKLQGVEAATPRKLLEYKHQAKENVMALRTIMATFSKTELSAGEFCIPIFPECKSGCVCLPINLFAGVCVGSC